MKLLVKYQLEFSRSYDSCSMFSNRDLLLSFPEDNQKHCELSAVLVRLNGTYCSHCKYSRVFLDSVWQLGVSSPKYMVAPFKLFICVYISESFYSNLTDFMASFISEILVKLHNFPIPLFSLQTLPYNLHCTLSKSWPLHSLFVITCTVVAHITSKLPTILQLALRPT